MPVYTSAALVIVQAVVVAEVLRQLVASSLCVDASMSCSQIPAFSCIFAGCVCQVDRGCNVLEFHEKPPRTQLATMSIDTLEYGFGEGRHCSKVACTQACHRHGAY
jgi:hypothetical protein